MSTYLYRLNADVRYNGVLYPRNSIVNDELGQALANVAPQRVVRTSHDQDHLCAEAKCPEHAPAQETEG